jgi:hypothetical protein
LAEAAKERNLNSITDERLLSPRVSIQSEVHHKTSPRPTSRRKKIVVAGDNHTVKHAKLKVFHRPKESAPGSVVLSPQKKS